MLQISTSPLPVVDLLERTIRALANADAASALAVLDDCSRAEMPASPEEFSRALTQKVALEKMLEQTARNLRVRRSEEDDFRYGRRRGRNS
jgi:hypothetical protein